MKADPLPDRHALLIAVQDYDPSEQSKSRGLDGRSFKPLSTPRTDAKIMEQELSGLRFNVRRQEDMTAFGISSAVDRFVSEARKRHFPSSLSPNTSKSTGEGPRSYSQILLLYFSGHGVRMRGQQFAVGSDSRVTSINKLFVKPLRKALSNAAIIVLMDACGEAVDGSLKDHEGVEKVAKGAAKGASEKGTKNIEDDDDDDVLNGNLIACAYACQAGRNAYEGLYCSDWTEELAKNLKTPVDIKVMLLNVQDALAGTRQQPLIELASRCRTEEEFIAKPIPGTCTFFRIPSDQPATLSLGHGKSVLIYRRRSMLDSRSYSVEETTVLKQVIPGQEPKIEMRTRTLPFATHEDCSASSFCSDRTCIVVRAEDLELSFSKSPKHKQREIEPEDTRHEWLHRNNVLKILALICGILAVLAALWSTVAWVLAQEKPSPAPPVTVYINEPTSYYTPIDAADGGDCPPGQICMPVPDWIPESYPSSPVGDSAALEYGRRPETEADAGPSGATIAALVLVGCVLLLCIAACIVFALTRRARRRRAQIRSACASGPQNQGGSIQGQLTCRNELIPHGTAPQQIPVYSPFDTPYRLCRQAPFPAMSREPGLARNQKAIKMQPCGIKEDSLPASTHSTVNGLPPAAVAPGEVALLDAFSERRVHEAEAYASDNAQTSDFNGDKHAQCEIEMHSNESTSHKEVHRRAKVTDLGMLAEVPDLEARSQAPHTSKPEDDLSLHIPQCSAIRTVAYKQYTSELCGHMNQSSTPPSAEPLEATTRSARAKEPATRPRKMSLKRETAATSATSRQAHGRFKKFIPYEALEGSAAAAAAADAAEASQTPTKAQQEITTGSPTNLSAGTAAWAHHVQPTGPTQFSVSSSATASLLQAQTALPEHRMRPGILEMMHALAAQHRVLNNRFVLMGRVLHVGRQGCVHLAVDRTIKHQRMAVKTFFCHQDFWTEAALYLNDDVILADILPHCNIGLGAWVQAPDQHREASDLHGVVSSSQTAEEKTASTLSCLEAKRLSDVVTPEGKLMAESTPYIVMKAGVPLAQSMEVSRTLSHEHYMKHFKPFQVLRDIAKLLEALHGLGYMHRDVKPSNIVDVSDDPCYCVWRLIDVAFHAPTGQRVRPAGTLQYASPETVLMLAQPHSQQEHHAADAGRNLCAEVTQSAEPSMDIWGLGVIAAQLLTHTGSQHSGITSDTLHLCAMGKQQYAWEVQVGEFALHLDGSEYTEKEQTVVCSLIEGCLARRSCDRFTARQVVDILTDVGAR